MVNTKELIATIKSSEWEEKLKASDILARNGSQEVITSLILLLKSNDAEIRNASALALREIGDNVAVEPLFAAIHDPSNAKNRATLVYALEKLSCSDHFIDIFQLAISDKSDIQASALNILIDQGFYIDDDDLTKAHSMLDSARDLCVDYALLKFLLDEFRYDLRI